jgi:hypothetical protein
MPRTTVLGLFSLLELSQLNVNSQADHDAYSSHPNSPQPTLEAHLVAIQVVLLVVNRAVT